MMDSPAGSSLLQSLEISDFKDIYLRFTSFLQPFNDFIPLDSHNPKKSKKKKKAEINQTSVRPLAKKFLPFLLRTLKLLPNLLSRQSPKSSSGNVDDERATELFGIYRLILDCLSCVSPCLVGNPYFIHLERGCLIYCLESWGRYKEAQEEAFSLFDNLYIKPREGKMADLGFVDVDRDPEIVILAVKVVACIIGCAYKSKSKDGAAYERVLALVKQVSPWLRVLDPSSMGKYHSFLVNALYRCALFLAGECISFDSDLVKHFFQATLSECLQSSSIDRFQNISRNICMSIDKRLESRPSLILDMLGITLQNTLCGCKVGVVKAVNEFLEFVSYCAKSFCAASIDICRCASELLYKHGGDCLQVSPPVASILFLYATGLYFKSSNVQARQIDYTIQSSNDASPIMLFLDNGEKPQILTESLGVLARYRSEVLYNDEVKDTSDVSIVDLESMKHEACKHLHGNASFLSYLDALEFLCKLLVDYVNMTWEYLASQDKAVCLSANINHVQDVLHQFCDFILAALKCAKISEKDRERLHESRKTLLQVAVSALKICLGISENHQKSLFFNCVISSEWIEPQELKYFISALGNIGASLYNIGHLKQASITLQLRCKTIWTHVKLLCQMYSDKSKGIHNDDISEDVIKSVTADAFERCAMIVDVLHKCGAAEVHAYAVKSLVELSAVDDLFPDLTGSLALVKQWVKMLCKDFEEADAVGNAPVLYSLLLSHCSTWSKKTLGKILEQELLAYGLMEARNPDLCQKMQAKVIDILLDDVFTAKEYNLQRSRILVRKGRALRTRGIEGLSSCIKCLREAISLLEDISHDPSTKNALLCHQLALTYILDAQCTQEAAQCTQKANQDREVILQDVRNALELWSSIDIQGHCSLNGHLELQAKNTILLLCSIVDLLSMKGRLELQFDICKLIIMFFKRENVPLDKCLVMLWSERRISHSLCFSAIDEDSILNISEHFGNDANSVDFWISCLKGYPSYLLAFLQKFLLCDSVSPEVSLYNSERTFGSKVTVDEVKKVASSLISDIPLASQSASIAGYLYYDLSERLFSNGRLFEALFYARVALRLRRKILQRKFICSFGQQPAESMAFGKVSQNKHDHVCLEAIGTVITEVWPDISKSSNLENTILTPWSVLRCYLESILQVGMINESIGNGAEAEVLFLTGKRISCLQDLPIFRIVFASLLGKLYRKKQLWNLAENELNSARSLLLENDMIISCKRCKLALEVSIDLQFGDLSRNRPEGGSHIALDLYQSALDKLNQDELKSALSICKKPETVGALFSKNEMQEAKHGVLNTNKMPSTLWEVRSPACSICASSTLNLNVHHDGQMQPQNEKLPLNVDLHKGIKKKSRIPSKSSQTEHSLIDELKPRTRFSKRASHNRSANAADGVDNNYDRSANQDICPDILSLGKSRKKLNGSSSTDFGCNEECISNKTKCWRCHLIKVMESRNMQNIIYHTWECHRRRLLLRLLLKIAKSKCGAHEVHDVYWQCISVMFNQKPLSHSNSDVCGSFLIELIGGEGSRDIFSVEQAAVLYNMSCFVLKDCHSENSRTKCCTLANIQMPDVVPWLLRAFILCRELPLLFQKVSKLLSSILLISTIDGSISLPFYSESSLSISHWAAYFHQASLGTYLPCQYLACVKDNACSPKASEDACSASMLDTVIKASNFLRFAPERLEHLEEFVREFFQVLPSVPIICISMLGGDYVNLIGEKLLLPSYLPAWMLISRLNANVQPIAMLLPVDRIPEEVQVESVKEWQCPWGYTVVDYVAPSFKQLLKENFLSSNMTPTNADAQMNNINWWSQRTRLNKCLNKFLTSMEDSWLGPWGCLLLGERSDPYYLSKIVPKLINELKFHCKFEANDNLLKAILGGSKSVADVEACISQLLLYKGYFGRGACCGEERLRAFSAACHKGIRSMPVSIHRLLLEAIGELGEPVDREPVILVLDSDVQMLSWENLPILRSQEVYRMPSVGSISLTLKRCSHYHKQAMAFGAGFPSIDPLDTYYLLNPSGDLDSTQVEFEQWFRNQKWEGKAGKVPTTEELVLALRNHDLFLYFGHGSGMQYIPGKEIQKLDQCAATLLMGCSSGSLTYEGCYAPRGAPLSYLFAGSPAVIANLWEVTDKDIDRFGKAMLKSWLQEESLVPPENCTRCNQLAKEFGCLEIDGGRNATLPKTRNKAFKNKKLQKSCDKGTCKVCGSKRIASFMSESRDACKLPFLIGASPVCYGVPTIIMKKS